MARVGQRLILSVLIVMALLGCGLLAIAAAIAWLQPVAGLGGALAITAGGLLVLAALLALTLRSTLRKAREKRRSQDQIIALVEVALAVLPHKRVLQLEATVAAGLAIGTVLLHLLKADKTD